MKKVRLGFMVAAAVCILGVASSALAATITFKDDDGHWWTGGGQVTLTLSLGNLPAVNLSGSTDYGTGTVWGDLYTGTGVDYYMLDYSDVDSNTAHIGVSENALGKGVQGIGNNLYIAWDIWNTTIMLFAGDTSNGYGYFGIDFGGWGNVSSMASFLGLSNIMDIGSLNWSSIFCSDCSNWSKTFTLAANATAIYGKDCNPVPIPAAAWLLGSGLGCVRSFLGVAI